MDSRQRIKEEFTYYLSNIARSSRRTDKGFNLQPTAVQSFLAFLEVDRLFDYKPEIWKHIKSMYDITVPNEVENIADTLLNDEEFAKHDNDKNQRWRSGSIIHYVCFIKARSYFVNEITNVNTPYDDGKKDGLEEKEVIAKPSSSLQQIYYGAPGTGKSYEINDLTKAYSTIRTTFHPDSDYSTFVGAYKPVMAESTVYGLQGEPIKVSQGDDVKVELKEPRITYTFVKQAFLKAYLGAWQKYANGNETAEPQFLVIEEINRGNCAQIFGDLFQLLDRSDNGFSTYPIEADSDLQNEIKKAFAEGGEYAIENGLDVDDAVDGYTSNYGETLSDDIKNGRVLLLPNNLYIWATMNTSDQSLFPIDSAFKRRWDWRYVKIADAGKGWKIRCGNEYCDWWKFVEEINKRIAKETSSDDKKLGYFFCKPPKDSSEISEEKFVGKVLFYLWNDVFKDGDISLFKVSDEPEAEICFDAFYGSDNKVNIEAIRTFLVGIVGEENIKTNDDTFITVDENGNAIDYTKYSFDGKSRLSKKDLGYSIVMKYISEHSDKTFAELQSELAFDDTVDNKYRYKGVLARTEEITGSYTWKSHTNLTHAGKYFRPSKVKITSPTLPK